MPLLQLFVSLLFLCAFFVALFTIAWYIAVPLLILWVILYTFNWGRTLFYSYRDKRAANGCSLHQTHNSPDTSITVIDVDYTEIEDN